MPIQKVSAGIEKKSAAKPKIDEISISGRDILKYNRAAVVEKNAKKAKESLKPDLISQALKFIFRQNVKGGPVQSGGGVRGSVVLTDETQSSIRVSLQEKYAIDDAKEVEGMFEGLGRDAGDFVTGGLKIKFDETIFNDPATGNFDERIFRRFERAIKRATKQVEDEINADLAEGQSPVALKNPLTAEDAYFVKADFHEARFREFTTAENLRIQEVVVATVQLTPIIP